jgi:GNAT superfamily N-acetyltransferase
MQDFVYLLILQNLHMKDIEKVQDLKSRMTFEPLTVQNWNKFIRLFGPRGACANCWCMYYRLESKKFKEGQKNDLNLRMMQDLVTAGKQTGLLGLLDGSAIGWCALSPREDFLRLERSRIHKRIDDEKVWSIPCFFIDKKYRGMGASGAMLLGAIKFAEENGISILEGYPFVPSGKRIPASFAWYGVYSIFSNAGFEIAGDKSPKRPIVRINIRNDI